MIVRNSNPALANNLAAPSEPLARAEQPRSIATRTALLTAARRLFGSAGYFATGTNEIVAEAEVTRGALYHHYRDKEHLFEAVFCVVADELSRNATEATSALSGQSWQRTLAAVKSYLRLVASSPETQRILLVDGPSVLGWQRWRELQSSFRLAGWLETLRILMEQKIIRKQPKEALAHLITAAVDDAALMISHSDDQGKTLEQYSEAIETLLTGLKMSPRKMRIEANSDAPAD